MLSTGTEDTRKTPSTRRARSWLWLLGGAAVLLGLGVVMRPSEKPSVNPVAEPAALEGELVRDGSSIARRADGSPAGKAASFQHGPRTAESDLLFRLLGPLSTIDAEPDPMTRENLMRSVIENVAFNELPTALAALQDSEQTPAVTDLSVRLVRHWAENNPQAAADWVAQMPEGPLRRDGLDQAAIAWANRDSAKAAAWAQQLPDAGERLQALRAVIYETVRAEPVEAMQLAMTLEGESERNHLVHHAAREWSLQRPVDATNWARDISDPTLRAQVLATTALAWSEHDAWEAGRMAIDELPPGRLQSDTIVGIAQRWAERDPEQTAAWIEQFPPGELKRAAANSVTAIWSLHDPGRAQYWRGQLAVNLPLTEIPANQTKP